MHMTDSTHCLTTLQRRHLIAGPYYSQAVRPQTIQRARRARIPKPCRIRTDQCTSSVQEVAVALADNEAAYATFRRAQDAALEAALTLQHEQALRDLEERLLREAHNTVAPVLRHIIDNVLTTRCPRCGQAFHDWDGCLALKCRRVGCTAAFCAVCLTDCGGDAHAHVQACQWVPGGNLFAAADEVPALQSAWRVHAIRTAAAGLPAAARARLVEALRPHLPARLDAALLL